MCCIPVSYWLVARFCLTSQNMIHCYWSAWKFDRSWKTNEQLCLDPHPMYCLRLDSLPPKSWLLHGSGTHWIRWFPLELAFCMSSAHTGWNWIPKSSILGDCFLTPAVLLRHWRVCYRHTCSLFPVWFNFRWTWALGYDFNKKQCQRGEGGAVEVYKEISSPQDVRRISHGSSKIGSNSVHLSNESILS